ncbi:MAG: M23 family metallopeptidase [Rhodothermales bacterium]|nr:M23 family metallopeptidase [Rhodothermales bacterium]MDG2016571.1 M23 family metallopeptidase [Rhodothermales bacterium]HAY36924.1 hypothetical protein [Bacteroidota bacterium]
MPFGTAMGSFGQIRTQAMLLTLSFISLLFSSSADLPSNDPHVSPDVDCYEETFCIETEDLGNRVEVFVRSLVPWDITMILDIDMSNMRPDIDLPLTKSFKGESRNQVLTLAVNEAADSWSFAFDLKWILGDFKADHERGFSYQLPYSRGEEYVVGQGYLGNATHQGKYAIDWDMPEGTPIRAARGGLVMEVQEKFREGRPDPALKSAANYVKIRHDDGTIGNYVHLKHKGVKVKPGDRVKTGAMIARSGNTGFSTGPHLHFEVYAATRELSRRTIPVEFKTPDRGSVQLKQGRFYKR